MSPRDASVARLARIARAARFETARRVRNNERILGETAVAALVAAERGPLPKPQMPAGHCPCARCEWESGHHR